ncbi:MAG TPA: lysophospholipid acyltransferase family protein [Bryobacteraceae bacterium]|nr:lysophospholipid acyltransferase family protein [Bryobacteraceae bacterium]
MRDLRVEPPHVDRRLLRFFGAYVDWYLPRHFRAVRVAGAQHLENSPGEPLLVVMNHPGWWDPLVALTLALHLAPARRHYAPIDADALEKYKFFRKLGFFAVQRDRAAGAAAFLRNGEAILQSQDAVLWVTAQGTFSDPRVRPVVLKPGIGHLMRRLNGRVRVLPVAVEYVFGEEKFAEVAVRFGDPLTGLAHVERSPCEWTACMARALEQTQDTLASDVIARTLTDYGVVLHGREGMGGVYDLWRLARAALRGERFHRAHGTH